jgi:hypothetical protein
MLDIGRPLRCRRHAAIGDTDIGHGTVPGQIEEKRAEGCGDVLVAALGDLVDGELRSLGRHRHMHGLDEFARLPVLLAVGDEVFEIVRRLPRRSVSRAPSAINGGGVSPIGEPLAILPPIVPYCAPVRRCGRTAAPAPGCVSPASKASV